MNIKNNLFKVLLLAILFQSCKKDNIIVDKEPLTLKTYSKFTQVNSSGILYKKLPVRPTLNTGIKIDIGITNITTTDRIVSVLYSSNTAVKGTNYFGSDSVVVKAGTSNASLNIVGDYATYSTGQIDTVKIKIVSTGDIPSMIGRDSMFVILEQYCDVLALDYITSFFGSYNVGPKGLGDVATGPYEVIIDSLGDFPSSDPNTAIGLIDGLNNISGNPLKFKMDWDDPANFTVNIDNQYFYTNAAGKLRNVSTSQTAKSTFNSCSKTMDIYIDIVNPNDATDAIANSNPRWIHVEL